MVKREHATEALNYELQRLIYASIRFNIEDGYLNINEMLVAYRAAFVQLLESAEKRLGEIIYRIF